MPNLPQETCLIIPCYNEAKRLDFEQLSAAPSNCYFLFVNDGSKDQTLKLLQDNQCKNMFILDLPNNLGKAEAIRSAVLYLQTLPIYQQLSWIGYWDADFATPLDQLPLFFSYQQLLTKQAQAIWGSRIKKLGSRIERKWYRHYLGRIFATVAKLMFNIKSYDSQCGAKIFRKEIAVQYFAEPFTVNWIFDVELLLRMKNCLIIEFPLTKWRDIEGGSFKVFTSLKTIISDLLRLKKKYGTSN